MKPWFIEPPVTALVACKCRGEKMLLRNIESPKETLRDRTIAHGTPPRRRRQRSNTPSFNGANLLIFILQTSVGLTAD